MQQLFEDVLPGLVTDRAGNLPPQPGIWPDCATFRKAVIAGRLLRVTGRIERDGPVVHLIAEQVEDLSPMLATLGRPVLIFAP
jgi:hypothetical protein